MYPSGSARAKSRMVLALAAAAAVGAVGVGPNAALAVDGQWTSTGSGTWGDTNNWLNGIVADGGGAASFNAVNLSGDHTVTLDAARTLSTLTVVDTTLGSGSPGRYIFTDAGVPANSLSLSGAMTVSSGGVSLGGTAVMTASALNVAGIAGSTNQRPTFSIDGGSFTATGTSTITGNNTGAPGQFILNSGSATFNGILRTSNNEFATIRIAGGTFSAGALDVPRNSAGTVAFTSGIIVAGGTSTVGTVDLGSNNSNGAMSIEGGTFTANGAITVARQATANRGGALRVIGGNFFSTDAVDGIILSRQDEGGNVNQVATATFTGGVSTVEKFTLGYDAAVNAGSATLTVNGGTLYVGAGGIVRNGTGAFNSTVSLSSGTLGARTDWSTAHPMTLAAPGVTIKAADALDAAHNITLNGVLSGAGGFTKTGAGTLTLGGANTYSGATTVSQGTLAGTTTSVRGNITNNANVTFNQSTDGSFNGSMSGTGSVTKSGTGTVTLAPQTYTGATTVAGGTLALTGAHTSTSGVTVQSGAALALAGPTTVNAATFGATTPGDAQALRVNNGSGINTLSVAGLDALVAHGNTTIDVGSLGLSVGTFTLVDYLGTIGGTGGGFNAFTLGAVPPRVTANLVNNVGSTSIDLNISSIAEAPRWNGNINGDWDVGTISPTPTGTQNWRELTNNNATVYLESSVPGDQVLFDDSATGTTSVNIVAAVNPAQVTVNNPTKNYTFSGAKIGGPTPLIKQGAGSLTLSNPGNDYTGGTTISAGSIILGVANALPTAGNVTVAGGTLDLGGLSQDLSGALVLDGGTIANGTVNKSGANYDLRGGTVSGNLAGAVGVTKTTAGTVTLSGASSYTGATAIQNGTVQLGVANALPTGTLVTIGSGADSGTLNLNGFSQQIGGLASAGTGTANSVTNSSGTAATLAVNLPTGTQTFGGVISGNLTFEKQGAGLQNLTAINTYTGGTNLNGGTLSFTSGALGATGPVAFTGNSTLRWATGNTEDISPRLAALPTGVTGTLDTNGQTIQLNGTITGAGGLAKAGGGILVLAGANTYAGGTTVNAGTVRAGSDSAFGTGTVTLNAGTALQLGNGVTLANNVASNATTDNMLDVPVGSATYAGSFSASSGNQLRVAATGGGTLTLTGSSALPGIFVLNMGNIVVSGSGSISGTQALLGRPGSEANFALTLRDNASMSFTTNTNIGNARQVPESSLTIRDNASYSTGTTFNLLDTTTSPATSTVNLNGGTLTAGSFIKTSTGVDQTAIINFNGGTLRPSASSTVFLPALTGLTAQVLNGGAVVDTNGFDATIAAALVGVGSGGLTKNGAGTLTLTGTNTYSGGTNVNAGTLQVRRMHENNAVTIAAGAKLQVLDSSPTLPDHPSGDNAFVSRPSALTIAAGGQLDLGNNDLIVDYTTTSPVADVEALVASGFNGGEWNGDGIISTTALNDPNFVLAVAENALLLQPFGDGVGDDPLFAGQVVDDTTVLVKFTHRVDLDLDGLITGNDAAVFNAFFNEGQPATWQFGDLDYDGVYSGNDAAIFNGFYNESLASVPEPASLGLAACGLALLMRRWRRIPR